MRKLIKGIAALVPLYYVKASLVFAQEVGEGLTGSQEQLEEVGGQVEGGALASQTLPQLVGNIINIALGVLGIILVVLIVYGGVLWMTAMGDKEKVGTAKKVITNAIIGLVITVAAYAISSYVISALITAATG
jgi:hypothetical protein